MILRVVAIFAVILMAVPMVPAQLLSFDKTGTSPVQDLSGTEVRPTSTADLSGPTSRAGAYPALINTTDNTAATQYNTQRKIVRTINGTIHEVHESFGRVWYAQSFDNGKTWVGITDVSLNTNGNSVPAIATNGTNIYIIWREGNSVRMRRTFDDGTTWLPALNVAADRIYQSGGGAPNSNTPAIAASGAYVYYTMAMTSWDGSWDSDIFSFRNNNYGALANWPNFWASVKVNANNNAYDDVEPSIAAIGNAVHISYTGIPGGNRDIWYARSVDNGATFPINNRLITNVITDDMSSIAGIGNNISIAWEQNNNGNWEIFLFNSTNNGANWGAALNMSNNTGESRYPSVVRSLNSTFVVWQDTQDHATRDIFLAKYVSSKLSTPIDLTDNDQVNVLPSAILNISMNRLEYQWTANGPDPHQVLFNYYYVGPNKAPTLSFTGEQGYQTDGLNPEGNSSALTYTYRVDYTDADNDPPTPGYPEVWIDRDMNGDFNGPNEHISMSQANPADTTYTDGKRYTYSTTFNVLGTYHYAFRAVDEKNFRATGTPNNVMSGPKIDKINGPPSLTWVGDFGYATDGIEPQTGQIGDTFTYKVQYQDIWYEAPAVGFPKLYVDMDNDGSFNGANDKNYTMLPIVPSNLAYQSGVKYYYNLTIATSGTFGYQFFAQNVIGIGSNLLTGSGPKVLPKGHIPMLAFTGEANFATKAVNPDHGSRYTDFKFRINYTDADGQAPLNGQVTMSIDKSQNGAFEAGEQFVMTAVDAADTNYTDGKLYTYNTTLPVPAGAQKFYNFSFSAKDTDNVPAEGAGTLLMKVYVDITNIQPVLQWTLEDNYTSAGLWPTTGTANITNFVYRVKYKDDDNNPPADGYPMVGIDIDLDGTIGADEFFSMSEVSAADNIYSDGKLYYLTTQLHKKGEYKYTFQAKDTYDFATGAPTGVFNGPSITTEYIQTFPPALAWTGAVNYEDKGVQPTIGTAMTDFVFKIMYSDADNDLPATGYPKLWIDMDHDGIYNGTNDRSVAMTGENASVVSVRDGKVYTATLNFTAKGVYNYTFEAKSSRANETPVPIGTLTGSLTVARGNAVPVLSWGGSGNFKDRGVDPLKGAPGDQFKYMVAYTDADNDPPAAGYPKVYIDMNADGVFNEATEAFTMTQVVVNTDYHNKVYQYTGVAFTTEGAFKYKFVAQDTLGAKANELAGTGPTVAIPIINLPPELVFPDEAVYKFDGLDPVRGTKKTTFTFKIMYKDPEADQPQTGYPQLWIDTDHDGKLNTAADKKIMTAENSGDFKTGRIYKFTIQLEPGFDYKYAFFVNNTANQTAYQGEFLGPIVEKEVKTTPSGRGDMFWAILLIVAVIVALILGLLIGRNKSKKNEQAFAQAEPKQREPTELPEHDTGPREEGGGAPPEEGTGSHEEGDA
jgi:hypothetical protein